MSQDMEKVPFIFENVSLFFTASEVLVVAGAYEKVYDELG